MRRKLCRRASSAVRVRLDRTFPKHVSSPNQDQQGFCYPLHDDQSDRDPGAFRRADRFAQPGRAASDGAACLIYATIILVVAMTAGQIILDAIGIHMHSLKVAGGIILFLFGSQMLFGKMDEKPGRSPEEGRDLAVFPLAVPSIAGGGAMMAVIVLTDNDVYTVPQRIETGVVLLVVLFLTYLLLLFSDAILRVIGRQGASVLVRVMGLILCSLAVEIVLTALGVGPWTTVAPQ